ncbi:MAG: heliorhodopsin HeR [Gaiellaceae bacterium]
MSDSRAVETSAAEIAAYRRLRLWNGSLALLHTAQAGVILALSNSFTLPLSISFLAGPPGSKPSTNRVYDLPIASLVAVFLLLAALDHALVAAPRIHRWYERNLAIERSPARWLEYSLSASLMIVLIAMLTGIGELAALLAIFGANVAMIMFGAAMERANRSGRPVIWLPFVFGCIAGAVPWIAIAVQIGYSQNQTGNVPGFVFAIFVSLFVLFNSFAANMLLQYKRVGPWRDYLFGERGYLVLSLVAKSLLAWQIFASTLTG